MAPLSWRHHTLIQALLSRGPLKEEDFHVVFTGVSGKNPVTHQQIFNDVLLKINKELAYIQFELRACRNQYDGKVYYGVVNNVSDDQSKLGTKYSVPQIAFYKGVIEAIVHDVVIDGCITNIEALNIRLQNQVLSGQGSQDSQFSVPAAFRNFSMSQKEKTLKDLIHDQWLSYTSTGKIGLGMRSFLDLRSWFRSNEVPSCDVCNEACVKAAACPNVNCNVRIHNYCLRKKFSHAKGSRACPACDAEWPRPGIEEEEAATEPESQATSAGPTRKTRHCLKAEATEEALELHQEFRAPELKKLRSCKVGAVDAGEATTSSQLPPRLTRRNNQR